MNSKKDKKTDEEGEKRQKKKNYGSYSRFIYKILKQVHPNLQISKKSMEIMDSFLKDMFERVTKEGHMLLEHSKKKTITSHDIEACIKFLLPGDLAEHAVKEIHTSLNKYKDSS